MKLPLRHFPRCFFTGILCLGTGQRTPEKNAIDGIFLGVFLPAFLYLCWVKKPLSTKMPEKTNTMA
jgi:hypothetical protein